MNYMENRPKTIFCDIDGTLVKHFNPLITQDPNHKMEIIEGTKEKLLEWDKLGYNIILITGRREGQRTLTKKQLQEAGIIYDKLIMGIGGGYRYLINDKKPDGKITCESFCIDRDAGISNINI